MSETDTVKIELQIPKKLWSALTWYVRQTRYWVCNDWEMKSYREYIIACIRKDLDGEVNSGVPAARDFITAELKELLE